MRPRLLPALLLALPAGAWAHANTQSYSDLEVGEDAVEMRLRTRDGDLSFALEGVDLDHDGELSDAELSAGRGAISAYFLRKVELSQDGEPCRGEVLGIGRIEVSPETDPVHFTNLALRIRFPLPRRGGKLSVRVHPYDDNDPQHQHLATAVVRGGHPVALFLGGKAEETLDLGASAPPEPRWRRLGAVFPKGVEHILVGWDHLLFLAALILVVQRPWALLGVVTGFTAGHTLTLVLAGLDVVTLPSRITEGAIAFSIAWVGARNALGATGEGRWKVAALFGLVHGFGFASALKGALPPDMLVPSLLVFNLGIEAGQLAVVALAWPLLRLLSARPGLSKAFSWAVAAAGAALCAWRLFG